MSAGYHSYLTCEDCGWEFSSLDELSDHQDEGCSPEPGWDDSEDEEEDL